MAVIEYAEGDHASGFVGLRVVTTLGLNTEYRQVYLSYRDYSTEKARALAEALNAQWREQADIQIRHNWLSRPSKRSGQGWLASGLRADLLRENKVRGGQKKMYFAPAFVVDGWPRQSKKPSRFFRINVEKGRSVDQAYQAAIDQYATLRKLAAEEQAALLSRQPPAQLFVMLAIKLGLKHEYVININTIRRRVGVAEI